MRKIVKIEFLENSKILCYFDNEEVRILGLRDSIDDKYMKKILSDESLLKMAQIGELGEIFWPELGEMSDKDGKSIPCNYDISPEFAYYNSVPVPLTSEGIS